MARQPLWRTLFPKSVMLPLWEERSWMVARSRSSCGDTAGKSRVQIGVALSVPSGNKSALACPGAPIRCVCCARTRTHRQQVAHLWHHVGLNLARQGGALGPQLLQLAQVQPAPQAAPRSGDKHGRHAKPPAREEAALYGQGGSAHHQSSASTPTLTAAVRAWR